jgi:hypothetical protein
LAISDLAARSCFIAFSTSFRFIVGLIPVGDMEFICATKSATC